MSVAPRTSADQLPQPPALYFDPDERSWATAADSASRFVPVPRLNGKLITDASALATMADDFGHLIHRTPLAWLRPGSTDDVVAMVCFARRHGIRLVGRGCGHTAFGQAQAEAGLIIDMRSLCQIHDMTPDQVRVDAGVIWRDLILATTAAGLTPPVLTDFTALTVGGTLSVGGVGGRSFRHGAQVDQVVELQVVTGRGELVTCSAEAHAGLFYGVLAGLGLCGILVQATLRLTPARQQARTYRFFYPDHTTLLADLRWLTTHPDIDYIRGNAIPVPAQSATPAGGPGSRRLRLQFFLEATVFYNDVEELAGLPDLDLPVAGDADQVEDRTYVAFTDQVVQLVNQLDAAGLGQLPHPWLDLFVPDSAVNLVSTQILTELDNTNFGPGSLLLFYPFSRETLRCPLFQIPNEPTCVLVDILRTIAPDPDLMADVVAQNRHLYEWVVGTGGQLYPIGAVPMDTRDWARHFGPLWQDLTRMKQEYDPDALLGAGLRVFG
ncbi:FAD/FMN-containing dehydrogenase [Spirosoma lacussanchae]|uniref:FAD-binding protein n=1 Tax=Spirosoma lacussanchae TaxID=1884249 RepID=UPI001485EFFC|nr:FAD-binding protein [Spirosoma lacussanchae]